MSHDLAPPLTGFVRAPWDHEQVDALNRFQRLGYVHEFTCGRDHDGADRTLFATTDGWRCPHCDYQQDWAHEAMLHVEPLESFYKLPCDVKLPPATLLRKGTGLEALMTAFKARALSPPEANRFDDPANREIGPFPRTDLIVTAHDYTYVGRLAGVIWKASGAIRYAVEDASGRLFIHNHEQIDKPEGWLP